MRCQVLPRSAALIFALMLAEPVFAGAMWSEISFWGWDWSTSSTAFHNSYRDNRDYYDVDSRADYYDSGKVVPYLMQGFSSPERECCAWGEVLGYSHFGQLGVEAIADGNLGPVPGYGSDVLGVATSVNGYSAMEDTWTFHGPSNAGLYVELWVRVNGQRNPSNSFTGVGVDLANEDYSDCNLSSSSLCMLGRWFWYERATDVKLTLSAWAGTDYDGSPSYADADFLHTATIESIHFFDADYHEITGVTMTALSGHDYLGSDVPEPKASVLLLSGLIALWLARRGHTRKVPVD